MPELSQRTLGKVIGALAEMVPPEADTFPLIRDFWSTKLFAWGFPEWLIEFARVRSMNWSVVVRELFAGRGSAVNNILTGRDLCHQMLRKLTLMAYSESKSKRTREDIRLSLQLDGFDVGEHELKSIDGPVSIEGEKSLLLDTLRASKFSRQDVIVKHINDAEEHFNQGKHHSAIGEARSAFQAVIDETVFLAESKVPRRSGGGVKNQIEFLGRESFLTTDEQQAFLSAWGFLSSGNHPGLTSEEEGRIGTILCLEFIQILLIKCRSLLRP